MAASDRIDILGVTSQEFVAAARERGVRDEDALTIYRRAFREGDCDEPWVMLPDWPIVDQLNDDGTTKFILRHEDGLEIESVILPRRGKTGVISASLCVSSQVGCAMGCEFCETAQMGLMKNLTAAEIVGQWFTARHRLNAPIRNIVFMGMGEPLDNLQAVMQAIRIFTDRNGPEIAPARISVSTVGRAREIRALAQLARTPGFGRLKLAVSVNAPNDAIRSRIMPINRGTPMARLKDAMLDWPTERSHVLIEYVLIPGVNDEPGHADELAGYLAGVRCRVNVIPYNPRRDSPWPAPDEAAVASFVGRLAARGVAVSRRTTYGRSVMAACGQLGNPGIRGRRVVTIGTGVRVADSG